MRFLSKRDRFKILNWKSKIWTYLVLLVLGGGGGGTDGVLHFLEKNGLLLRALVHRLFSIRLLFLAQAVLVLLFLLVGDPVGLSLRGLDRLILDVVFLEFLHHQDLLVLLLLLP